MYGLSQHFFYARRLNREKLDLFHMPHFDVPYLYAGRLVVTVHDLIHIHFPEYSTKPFSRAYASAHLGAIQARRRLKRSERLHRFYFEGLAPARKLVSRRSPRGRGMR